MTMGAHCEGPSQGPRRARASEGPRSLSSISFMVYLPLVIGSVPLPLRATVFALNKYYLVLHIDLQNLSTEMYLLLIHFTSRETKSKVFWSRSHRLE